MLQSVVKRRNHQTGTTFCVLPIRGAAVDSRSRPFQKLGDKFLLDHVLEAVLASKIFLDVIVSTPDERIANYVGSAYGGDVLIHQRKIDTSRINMGIDPVILDIVQGTFPQLADCSFGMLLGVDRPFNKTHLFSSAIAIAQIFNVDNVIGVRPTSDIFFNHTGDSLEGINFSKSSLRLERNDLYQMVRGFSLFKVKNILEKQSIWGDIISHVVLDQQTAFCIETELDLVIAESMLAITQTSDV